MFSTAVKDFEAKRSNDVAIRKPVSTNTQQTCLSSMGSDAGRKAPAAGSRPPSHALRSLPANARNGVSSSPLPPNPQARNRDGLVSLCHASGSFAELPDPPTNTLGEATTTSVYIADDDLSEDDGMDFDFKQPSALPKIRSGTSGTAVHDVEPTAGSEASILSWPQSSPSHFLPPRPKTTPSTGRVPPKRDYSVAHPDARPPTAKKRTLPGDWTRPRDEARGIATLVDPARHPNSTSHLPWNTTASDVMEQKKKHLRGRTRKPASAGSGVLAEDLGGRTKVHGGAVQSKTSATRLSDQQRHVLGLVCDKNHSIFFTGPAGTGKSVLMRAIIKDLKKKWAKDPDRLAVTASTGLAACNIGGMTLHSFAGIGLGKEDVQTLVKKIRRNPKAKNRWLRTKVLVIDEISMVDGDLFDKLSQIGRTIRNNGRPWGGIQLVITGDFFQLPPVADGGGSKRESKFAFEAATWTTSIDHTIGLTEVFRQKDPEFAGMLNEMRLGRISDDTVRSFKALSRPLHFDDGLEFTELFPTRAEVEISNKQRLAALKSQPHRYEASDTGDPLLREKLLQNMMAPKSLELKKGAQVMLIKNMDETLVNGSLGTVIKFVSEAALQITGGGDGYSSGEDEDGAGAGGNVSRAVFEKRLKALSNQLEDASPKDNKEYPLVRFHAMDGSARVLLCVPEEWKSELPTGEVQASRSQVPLILAWALSIHKAQGQTLERVKVDLGKVFEKGQAYVALSRATSQQGLQVLRFEKSKVMAHPRVVQFYDKLYSAGKLMSA